MSNVENPGWLFDIRDYTTQFYRYHNKAIIRIPIKQPVFHGMSAKGFDRCSHGSIQDLR